jgi:hypothetical protein
MGTVMQGATLLKIIILVNFHLSLYFILLNTFHLIVITAGPLFVNQIIPKMEELEKHLSESYGGWVQKGGAWRPSQCKARVKVCYVLV